MSDTPDTRVLREAAQLINPDDPKHQRAIAMILDAADALERQEDVTWGQRIEAAGLRMMPTAWPAMTPKERQVYIDRWEPIAKAFFPDLAPKEPTP